MESAASAGMERDLMKKIGGLNALQTRPMEKPERPPALSFLALQFFQEPASDADRPWTLFLTAEGSRS
jgi:hypothetical protein